MLTAKDIMTKDVITVKDSTTIEELAGILVKNKISGAPVVNDAGELVGIVTENDLISRDKRLHIPTVMRIFDAYVVLERPSRTEKEIKKMVAVTVDEICTRNVAAVNEDAPLDKIASMMSEKNAHLIPVVSGRHVRGIIGKIDLIKAMIKQ